MVGRRLSTPNYGNFPGKVDNLNILNFYTLADIDTLPGSATALAGQVMPNQLLHRDTIYQKSPEASQWKIAIDRLNFARKAAELQVTFPMRLDIMPRDVLTLPTDFVRYNTSWLVQQVTLDIKANTTAIKAVIFED